MSRRSPENPATAQLQNSVCQEALVSARLSCCQPGAAQSTTLTTAFSLSVRPPASRAGCVQNIHVFTPKAWAEVAGAWSEATPPVRTQTVADPEEQRRTLSKEKPRNHIALTARTRSTSKEHTPFRPKALQSIAGGSRESGTPGHAKHNAIPTSFHPRGPAISSHARLTPRHPETPIAIASRAA